MASYTAMARISESMLKNLQSQLAPELIRFPGEVALCSPAQRENTKLGIFLYDIQESETIRPQMMTDLSYDSQRYPSIFMSLHYMITAYSDGDIRFRAIQEERVLGKVIQYFHDHPKALPGELEARIELQRLSTEDKLKLWTFPGQPYKASLYYKVEPVPIDSAMTRKVSRVRERRFQVEKKYE